MVRGFGFDGGEFPPPSNPAIAYGIVVRRVGGRIGRKRSSGRGVASAANWRAPGQVETPRGPICPSGAKIPAAAPR